MQSEFLYKGRIISKKVTYEGITFDSEMECEFYKVLKTLESDGRLKDLSHHVVFPLVGPYVVSPSKSLSDLLDVEGLPLDKTVEGVNYEADFVYVDTKTDEKVVIDVKGILTPDFKIKKKLFETVYKIPLNVVVYDGPTKRRTTFEERERLVKSRRHKRTVEKNELKNEVNAIKKKQEQYNRLEAKLKEKGKLTPKETEKMNNLKRELLGK